MSAYAKFHEVGADNETQIERITIDLPNDLKSWKKMVSMHPIVVLYIWKQSCGPCVLIKNKYEKWVLSMKKKYNDTNNTILFVKDCLDKDGPFPTEGTPSSVHNRMAPMVPYFIVYYNSKMVFKHAGFEAPILELNIDTCVEDYIEQQEQLQINQQHQEQQKQEFPNNHVQFY
jgi:hypothetical protein